MKPTRKLLIFAFTFLALAASAYAQSPREQLKQMVQQLQKIPGDSALREKIIKLARTMKPAPALPDTAIAFEGRAQFAFRSAKSEGDFLAAAQEYEKAVATAPWVPGYYADLCTIYEKAGKFEDAKRHCGFYLIGLTDPAQMTDVKRRIAGLEFGIEKANSPEARAAKQKARDDDLMKSLEGAVFSSSYTDIERQYRIANGRAVVTDRRLASGGPLCSSGAHKSGPIGEQMTCPDNLAIRIEGRRGMRTTMFGPITIEIADDGQTLLQKEANGNEVYDRVFKRQ
jgi:hypothetical protein